MAFDINVIGTRGYSLRETNCPDKDIFQAATAIGVVRALGRVTAGRFDEVGRSGDRPLEGGQRMRGVHAIAQMSGIHILGNGLLFLAATTTGHRGVIDISLVSERAAWANKARNIQFRFNSNTNDEPAVRFCREVFPVLEEFGMNNYGVLLKMGSAISAYSAMVRNENPRLLIILRNTVLF